MPIIKSYAPYIQYNLNITHVDVRGTNSNLLK